MPRSDYIYLVRTGDLLSHGSVPVAAFTEKHEMQSWLKRQSPDLLDVLTVFRLRDGGDGTASGMSVKHILEG